MAIDPVLIEFQADYEDALAGIEGLEEALASLQAVIDEASAAFDEAVSSVEAYTSALVDAGGAADEAAVSMDGATAAVAGAGAAADAAAASSDALAASFKKLKMPLLLATAAVIGSGVAALHMAGDFQAGVTSIVTGAGESAANMQLISTGILQMATDTGTSVSQLISGLYMIESGGFHGKAGLDIRKAAAEGAKVGTADLGVVADATDTIIKNFGENGALTAANAVNTLIATVANGKTHMQDLATALAMVLPTGAAAGVGLNDVMAAMATMTSIGVPAANAATYLRQTIIALSAPGAAAQKTLKSIGLTAAQVADEMHKSLPGALQMIEDHLTKKFPIGSAGYIAAVKSITGGSKTMQGFLDLTGNHMAVFTDDVKKISSAVKEGGSNIKGWDLVQRNFNQTMDKAKETLAVVFINLGNALMPLATTLAQHLIPALTTFGNWIASHGQQAAIIFGALAAALGGALLGVLVAVAGAFIAANIEVIAIAAAIGVLIAGIVLLVTHWQQVMQFLAPVGKLFQQLLGFIAPIGQALQQSLGQVLQNLGATLQQSLIPAWHSLQAAFEAAKPVLIVIGAVLGAILVVAVGTLLAVLRGLAAALGPIIGGIAQVFGGIIQVIAGVFQVVFGIIGGVIKVIGDLLGGHFDRIGQDFLDIWNNIKAGVGNILGGLWHIIQGAFQAIFGGIIAYVGGFIGGILGFFKHLGIDIPAILGNVAGTVLGALGGFFGGVFGAIGDAIGGFLGRTGQMFQTGFQIILNIIMAPIHAVVNLFSWLFAHNYYFHNLVVAIQTAFTNARAFITNAWTFITHWLAQQWNRIKADAMLAWVLVQAYIIRPIQRVIADVQAKLNDARVFIENVWNQVKADAQAAWDHFLSLITNAVTQVKDKATDVANSILTPIKNIAQTLFDAGKNLITMLINGITSMAGKVGDAAKNIAGKITSFLGFHSPAEEGPGATADQWMPNLITMMASGLSSNAGRLAAAARLAAGGLAGGFSGGVRLPTIGLGGAGLPAGGAGAGLGGGATTALLAQILGALQSSRGGATAGAIPTAGTLPANVIQQFGGLNFHGVQDIAGLYKALNLLAGLAQENAARGATAGIAV